MSKLIKIIPKTKKICVDIEIGNICNYSCSYCHPNSHSGSSWNNYNKLINFIDKVTEGKLATIILSGGEPTLYPRIDDILKHIKRDGIYLAITSNGSRSLRWWKERLEYFDKVIFSYHPEYVNMDDFYKKVEYISNKTSMEINVSMMHDKFDECYEAAKKLHEINNTDIVLKALKNKKTGKLYEYTHDQLKIMSKRMENKNKNKSVVIEHLYENGDSILKYIQEILSEDLNKYKGWKCWKGIDLIKIQATGKYYLASCDLKHSKYYGDINDNINLPTKPVICEYDYCFCVCDLMHIRKEK